MTEIVDVDIRVIRPDKNQPRKLIDPVRVKEIAKSIETEGIINPIEIDEDNVIITGEVRWRAAKVAGKAFVPCKVFAIGKRERFRRQMIENLHHNTMTPMETAGGLKKLLEFRGWKPSEAASLEQRFKEGDEYVSKLSIEVGKSERYIYTLLNLLKEKPEVREWLEKPGSKYSFIGEANQVKPKYRNRLKKKIIKDGFANKEAIREVMRAIKRSEDDPKKVTEILSLDLSKTKQTEVAKTVRAVSPKELDPVEMVQKGSLVIIKINEILKLLCGLDPERIMQADRQRILVLVEKLRKETFRFETGKMIEGETVE